MTTIESSTRGNPDDPGHRSSSRSGQPSPDDGHHGGHAPDDAFAEAERGAIGQTAPGADGERSTEPQQADGNRYGPRQFEQLPGDKPMAKAVLRLNYLFRGLPE
ncbi:MAG TPA: hypothetical protein VFY39_05320, partial [Gammaproteobacteria bacterium]|nr:hypothetical protein [Gammaproteobacteria bacterium]